MIEYGGSVRNKINLAAAVVQTIPWYQVLNQITALSPLSVISADCLVIRKKKKNSLLSRLALLDVHSTDIKYLMLVINRVFVYIHVVVFSILVRFLVYLVIYYNLYCNIS